MLVRFSVKNFLSFDENQEFTMIAGSVRNKDNHLIKDKNINLLRFAALYGPNASGKSSLVKALRFSKHVITKEISPKVTYLYFKLRRDAATVPTTFEYEFNIGTKYYAYGFNILLAESKFTGEWLYELKPSGDSLMFERDLIGNAFESDIKFKTKDSQTRFDIYWEDIRSNDKVLFLSELNRNKESVYEKFKEFEVFSRIFNWFKDTLDINFPDDTISSTEFFIYNDRSNNNKLFDLLDCLGTGITDFKLVNSSLEEVRKEIPPGILNDIEKSLIKEKAKVVHLRTGKNLHILRLNGEGGLEAKTMHFFHGVNGGDFTLSEESDGTRRLLELLEILLGESEKVYVIDEIDRSLHPNLTYKFIELFLDMLADKKIQLIITTHEDRILDLKRLLRRDEIWFIEKQESGSSKLYSLEQFKTRFDEKILNSYLEGRYGAVPVFKKPTSFQETENGGGE